MSELPQFGGHSSGLKWTILFAALVEKVLLYYIYNPDPFVMTKKKKKRKEKYIVSMV